MKPTDLLHAWAQTRQRAETWRAMFDDDPLRLVRACGAALAAPQEPAVVLATFLADGAFELAELFLLDEHFVEVAGPARLTAFESDIALARTASLNELEVDLGYVIARAGKLSVTIDATAIRDAASRSRDDGRRLLAEAEQRVKDTEADLARALTARLDAAARPFNASWDDLEHWRASVRRALACGDFDAAEAALAQGPTADRPQAIDVPEPVWWAYSTESLAELLGWCLGDRPAPPAFTRFMPRPDDAVARDFLSAAQRWASDAAVAGELLRQFAAVMGCTVVALEELASGPVARLHDLSAPGLHAFGRRRWPDGVPVEVDGDATFLVRIESSMLRLSIHTVLAALHDPHTRRRRLLAELARQIPLDLAFESILADESVRWERENLDLPIGPDSPAVLLISAPGTGSTTLLRELAEQIADATVIDAPRDASLPDAPAIFLDRADQLDTPALRALIREIHWVRTTRPLPPAIVLAGRPELRTKLRGLLPPRMFVERVLPLRSLAALREQARVTLAWVGIQVTRPGIYDRIAWLASGNPTLLLFLCRAAARLLAERAVVQRLIDDELVEAAWQTDELRRAARALLWDPVNLQDGVQEVIRAIAEVEIPGRPLRRDDLEWVLRSRDSAWIDERLQLLAGYGLIQIDERGVFPWPGGLSQLVPAWRDG